MDKLGKKIISLLCSMTLLLSLSIPTYGAPTLNEIKAKSYKHFELTSEKTVDGKNEKTYDVYLYSDTGKIELAKDTTCRNYVGDKLFTGHLKLAYALKGSNTYQVYDIAEDKHINLSQERIKVVHNYGTNVPDFLTIMEYGGWTAADMTCYAIVNNTFYSIPFIDKQGNSSLKTYVNYNGLDKMGDRFATWEFVRSDWVDYVVNIYKYDINKKQLICKDTIQWSRLED